MRIGLFATEILTPDNVQTFVGNTKVFGDNIMNYSASEEFGAAGYPVPEQHLAMRQVAAKA